MRNFSGLRGLLGRLGIEPRYTSSGGTSSGIPKSDYIKELQCLINPCIVAPQSNRAWQSSKELWNAAVAWDNALPGGMPITGTYRTAWPTLDDAIWMLSRAGVQEFQAIDSRLPTVDSNLIGYIQACKAYLQRQGNEEGYWIDYRGCEFPRMTQERLDAEAAYAAQAAAIAAAEQKAIAEEQARREAEAAAIEAAKAAAAAAAAAQAEAAAEAARVAAAAAEQAKTEAATKAAAEAAAAAAAAQQAQTEEQNIPSAGSKAEIVDTTDKQTVTIPVPGFFMRLTRMQKVGVGVGAGVLLAAIVAGAAARSRKRA